MVVWKTPTCRRIEARSAGCEFIDSLLGLFRTVDPAISLEAFPAQTQAQVRAIYDGVPVGLCFLDCNFRFVSLNKRLASMHRLSIDEHLGRSPQEILLEVFRLAEPYLIRARAGEVLENIEMELTNPKNGLVGTTLTSYQPALDEAGEVVGILVSVTDITERKRIETELQESHDHYASMVTLNPQIPWTMHADGTNLELSPRWEQLTGSTANQITGENWLRSIHPDDRVATSERVYKALKQGLSLDMEFRLVGKDDAWHWIRCRGTPRLGSSGEVLRWYGCMEIIDQQRETLEALRDSRAQLQRMLDASSNVVVSRERRQLAS